MHRLWNFLFGWEYIAFDAKEHTHICRVRNLPRDGRAYVWLQGRIYFLEEFYRPIYLT